MRRDDGGSEPHSLGAVVVIAETEKAIGVARPDSSNEEAFSTNPFWVPKSVVHEDSEVSGRGDEGELFVKTWWAEKNGCA
jgi:hypothetical protein